MTIVSITKKHYTNFSCYNHTSFKTNKEIRIFIIDKKHYYNLFRRIFFPNIFVY